MTYEGFPSCFSLELNVKRGMDRIVISFSLRELSSLPTVEERGEV